MIEERVLAPETARGREREGLKTADGMPAELIRTRA